MSTEIISSSIFMPFMNSVKSIDQEIASLLDVPSILNALLVCKIWSKNAYLKEELQKHDWLPSNILSVFKECKIDLFQKPVLIIKESAETQKPGYAGLALKPLFNDLVPLTDSITRLKYTDEEGGVRRGLVLYLAGYGDREVFLSRKKLKDITGILVLFQRDDDRENLYACWSENLSKKDYMYLSTHDHKGSLYKTCSSCYLPYPNGGAILNVYFLKTLLRGEDPAFKLADPKATS